MTVAHSHFEIEYRYSSIAVLKMRIPVINRMLDQIPNRGLVSAERPFPIGILQLNKKSPDSCPVTRTTHEKRFPETGIGER